jgi:hypothetical protein
LGIKSHCACHRFEIPFYNMDSPALVSSLIHR